MACIQPDGSLTVSARTLLESLAEGPLPLTEITRLLRVPGFMARGNLRELGEMGLLREEAGLYHINEEGRTRL